jgi:sigma-B regulation protein RsbU (phosphoserine phosphatase)
MKNSVLIVDDSLESRKILSALVKKAGCEPREAAHGEEALASVRRHRPDLVLLDVSMPGMSGFEVCSRMKEGEQTREVPVIFLSAKTESKDRVTGLDCGASDYLVKPFSGDEVLARIRAQLRIGSLQNSLRSANQELRERQDEIERDLEAARELQARLVPQASPAGTGLGLCWRFRPCAKVGGDLFGVDVGAEKTRLYVADVCGHGVPAAMMSMIVAKTLQDVSPDAAPREAIEALNREISIDRYDRFVTLFCASFDRASGEIEYASAGHPPALIGTADGRLRRLEEAGYPIGMDFEGELECGTDRLGWGETLLLYSDGLIETGGFPARGGIRGLEVLVRGAHALELDSFGEAIAQEALSDTPKDDVTFLAARRTEDR